MNKTFNSLIHNQYSACVGINGHIDLKTYSDGYDRMVKLGLEEIDKQPVLIDILVYPLIYCARHRLELLLKHQLLMIKKIKKSKYDLKGIHQISTLWADFKAETAFDARFSEPIALLDEYINDYTDIDNTGEVFRYPETIEKNKHLVNNRTINLQTFGTRYLELFNHLDCLGHFTNELFREYEYGVCIDGFSRVMIKEVASKLPPMEQWKNPSFEDIKNKIKCEYSLSNTKLSKIIDIIKSNYEFSYIMGTELVIKQLKVDELKEFLAINQRFFSELSPDNRKETQEKFQLVIKETISTEAIIALAQLHDVGYGYHYPEQFDLGYGYKRDNENIDDFY